MRLVFDKRFSSKLEGRFKKYNFKVGILDDGPHKIPKTGKRGLKGQDVFKSFYGKKARQVSSKLSGKTISEVSNSFRKYLGFNYLIKPFKNKNSDIVKFIDSFMKLVFGRSDKRRTENLLQAVVRNPILRDDYGQNSLLTQRIKGFSHVGVDTGQMFRAIKAKCMVRR